jgi:hypothetical protein
MSSWWQTFGNHYNEKVALPLRRAGDIATFATENQDNHLSIESHQDVVRLESIIAMHKLCPLGFDSPADLAAEFRNLIHSRQPGQADTFTDDQRNRLAEWLDELNTRRDARPAFAAPFDEVEKLLATPDWAMQLRNVLGLAHFAGSASKPLPVILCRYNLSRVERVARKARIAAWAAVPTVLEAGGYSGPGGAFFPFPKAAASSNPFGFGVTVNLAADGAWTSKQSSCISASTIPWKTSPWLVKSPTRSPMPNSPPPVSDILIYWSRICVIVRMCHNHERSPPTLARGFRA